MNDIVNTTRESSQEWQSADVLPNAKIWAIVGEKLKQQMVADEARRRATEPPIVVSSQKRVLFTGRYWMTRASFSTWKPCPTEEKPLTALIAKSPGQKLAYIDKLEDIPAEDQTGDEIKALAQLARFALNVEVVRLYRPGSMAKGATSGKVLAVSESYAAQSLGLNGIIIHTKSQLSRKLEPGEQVTVNYEGGQANVYNGAYFDVNVKSTYLSDEQLGWLRMQMVEALSSVEDAANDEQMIQEALLHALDNTVETFSLIKQDLLRTAIELSVTDVMPELLRNEAAKSSQFIEFDEPETMPGRLERMTD